MVNIFYLFVDLVEVGPGSCNSCPSVPELPVGLVPTNLTWKTLI